MKHNEFSSPNKFCERTSSKFLCHIDHIEIASDPDERGFDELAKVNHIK